MFDLENFDKHVAAGRITITKDPLKRSAHIIQKKWDENTGEVTAGAEIDVSVDYLQNQIEITTQTIAGNKEELKVLRDTIKRDENKLAQLKSILSTILGV